MKHTLTGLLAAALMFSGAFSAAQAEDVTLHPDLATAIRLVDEAIHVLDTVAAEVWPEWKSYRDEIYFTAVPKVQDIMINPPALPGPDYMPLENTSHGMPVYLRDPSPIEKIWGGAYRFRLGGKRYKAARFYPPAADATERWIENFQDKMPDKRLWEPAARIFGSLEYRVAIIIHEAFHRFQETTNRMKIVNQTHPSPFDGSADQAALARLEGLILSRAVKSENGDQIAGLARQFLAVRQERRRGLTPEDIAWEMRNEFAEGSAMYVETLTFELLDRMDYSPRDLEKDEDGFYGFSIAEDMVNQNISWIEHSPKRGSDAGEALQRCYYFGLAQGLILDRLAGPSWKTGFFEPDVYFETLLAESSGFDPDNAAPYLEKAQNDFDYAGILAAVTNEKR